MLTSFINSINKQEKTDFYLLCIHPNAKAIDALIPVFSTPLASARSDFVCTTSLREHYTHNKYQKSKEKP
jgi:hypothetical protein